LSTPDDERTTNPAPAPPWFPRAVGQLFSPKRPDCRRSSATAAMRDDLHFYQRQAQHCLRIAGETTDPALAMIFRELAARWRRLAEQVEHDGVVARAHYASTANPGLRNEADDEAVTLHGIKRRRST
jgi:hypothetical protein